MSLTEYTTGNRWAATFGHAGSDNTSIPVGSDSERLFYEIPSKIFDSRLFSQLFDDLGEGVLISDDTGRIVGSNASAVRILGIRTERLQSLMHHDPIWQTVLQDGSPVQISEMPATKALRTGKAVPNVELGVVRPDGTLVWILESAAPLFDAMGRVKGVVTIIRDISTSVQQRNELRGMSQKYIRERDQANNANRLKSNFLANMSHEIRTPMTAILGFTEILMGELRGKLADHHTAFLQSIMVSGRRLLALLNDILDLSKIESGHDDIRKSELDVNAEIESAIAPLAFGAKQKGLKVKLDLHPESIVIQADRHRFAQVITNVVGNAIKFTSQGSVAVRTSLYSSDLNSNVVTIDVEDTGVGIPSEFLPHLFEEFRQGHDKEYGGTGLGLAISKRIVTRMGGTIEVHSESGQGTLFTIAFPVAAVGRAPVSISEEEEPSTKPEMPVTEPADSSRPLLVVEDNLETQRLLAAYLRDQHRLQFAGNAEEALAAIEKEVPSLILMDINLPGRDGLSITREIRSGDRCPSIPIVALTAFAMAGDKQKFLAAGCNEYLSKPATRREVLDTVNRLLQAADTPPAGTPPSKNNFEKQNPPSESERGDRLMEHSAY